MKGNTFVKTAKFYDACYADRDYIGEVNDAFSTKIADQKISWAGMRILDVGSGTGTCAQLFLFAGYKVVGVEPSIDMIRIARKKGELKEWLGQERKATFVHRTIEQFADFSYRQTFDVATCFFDVLDYILPAQSYRRALMNIHNHLKPGGLLYIEGWNKDMMPKKFEPYRRKEFLFEGEKVVRESVTSYKEGVFKVIFTFHYKGKKIKETHYLKPRLGGFNNWIEHFGFKLEKETLSPYSVKVWFKKT